MQFEDRAQHAILLCFYLARAGRAKISDAASNLKIDKKELTTVARLLEKKGILVKFKPPVSGYELKDDGTIDDDLTIYDILSAIDMKPFISSERSKYLSTGSVEHRTLSLFFSVLSMETKLLFGMTSVYGLLEDLNTIEMNELDSANTKIEN